MGQMDLFEAADNALPPSRGERQSIVGIAPPPEWMPSRAVCLFEQTGTFRDAFRRAGIPAECWDIEAGFGQTDRQIDLFDAVDAAATGKPSALDDICAEDVAMAFFPCTYFSQFSQIAHRLAYTNYRSLPVADRFRQIASRSERRELFFRRLCQLFCVAVERGWHLIVENPWNPDGFLRSTHALFQPNLIDFDRSAHGDAFSKPTAYWMINFKPRLNLAVSPQYQTFAIKRVGQWTSRSDRAEKRIQRSRITPAYADNFVRRVVLGDSSWRPAHAL